MMITNRVGAGSMPRRSWRAAASIVALLGIAAGCQTTPVEYPTGPERLAMPAAEPEGFETPPVFAAADILPPELVCGPNHLVVDPVVNDGFTNHFLIDSDFGTFQTAGVEMTATRVNEINAIAELQALRRRDNLQEGAKHSAVKVVKAPYRQIRKIVRNPLYLVAVIPSEIGLVAGIISELRILIEYGLNEEAVKEYIGFNDAKKDVARWFNVDPNSPNPVLQAELDEAAWSYFAGELPVRLADELIPGLPISKVEFVADGEHPVDVYDAVVDEVKVKTPGAKLRRMDVARADRKHFFKKSVFTRKQQKRLVAALYAIEDAEERPAVVQLANTFEDEADAWLLLRQVEMLADYHDLVEPVQRVIVKEPILLAHTRRDGLIVPIDCDYLAWTSEVAALIGTMDSVELPGTEFTTRQIWVGGGASPRLIDESSRLAFTVHEHVLGPMDARNRWVLADMRYEYGTLKPFQTAVLVPRDLPVDAEPVQVAAEGAVLVPARTD